MKNTLSLFLLFALFSIITSCVAPNVNTTPVAEDEKAVASAVDSLNKYIITPNKEALANLASDNLSYGHSGGLVQNKQQFVDSLVNGQMDFQTLEGKNQTISIAGNNAIVRHQFVSSASKAGAPTTIDVGNLLIWTKENGKWKLLARQAYKIPPPPPPAPPVKK